MKKILVYSPDRGIGGFRAKSLQVPDLVEVAWEWSVDRVLAAVRSTAFDLIVADLDEDAYRKSGLDICVGVESLPIPPSVLLLVWNEQRELAQDVLGQAGIVRVRVELFERRGAARKLPPHVDQLLGIDRAQQTGG